MDDKYRFEGYVAFFDMLGFASAIERDPDEAWGALCDLWAAMDKVLRIGIEVPALGMDLRPPLPKMFIFSDSVVMFTPSDDLKDLYSILICSSELFSKSLSTCVPLRGGISHGRFHFDQINRLFCGAPFVQAHRLGEAAQWLGISVDGDVADRYRQTPVLRSGPDPVIVQYNVPVKYEKDVESRTHWVVNWPLIFKESFTKKSPISVQDFYQAFQSLFGPLEKLEQTARTKYENTVEFVNTGLGQIGR